MAFGTGSRRQNSRQQAQRSSQAPRGRASRASARTQSRSTARASRAASPSASSRPAANRVTPLTPGRNGAKLQPLVLTGAYPDWLVRLLKAHKGVWLGTMAISGLALVVYSWSVYSQQQWGQAYQRLEQLRRSERQLIAGSEMMKNDIAQQVDPANLGLAPQRPDNVIFLQPAQAKPDSEQADDDAAATAPLHKPSGY